MSWYANKIHGLNKRWSLVQDTGQVSEVTMTLIVTDMVTAADGERLVQALQGLRGIKGVVAQPEQRKLAVTFQTPTIDIQAIALEIRSKGYHHLQKA